MDLTQFAKDVSLLSKLSRKCRLSNIPSLRNIWYKGGVLAATDLERWILIKSGVEFPHPVEATKLQAILSTMIQRKRVGEMKVEEAGLRFAFEDGGESLIKYACEIDEQPALPEQHTRLTGITINPIDLAYVDNARSTEVVRYALTGVCLHGRDKMMVGSDGKRMHFRAFKAEKAFDPILVPPPALDTIRDIHRAYRGEVQVTQVGVDDETLNLSFFMGRHIIFSRVIDGQYPDWKKVIPEKYAWSFKVDTRELREACRQASKLCQGTKKEAMQMKVHEDGTLRMRAKIEGNEEKYRATIHDGKGNAGAIANAMFNPDYLGDTLWDSDLTVIQGNHKTEAIVINGSAVLMPLTISYGDEKGAMTKDESDQLPKDIPLADPVKVQDKAEKPAPSQSERKRRDRANELPPKPEPTPPRKAAQRTPKPKAARKPKPKPAKKAKAAARPKPNGQKKSARKHKPKPKPGERTEVPLFNW